MKNVTFVKRRNQSGVLQNEQQNIKSATPVLQALFSQLASLKQKVNENALARVKNNKPERTSKSQQSVQTQKEESENKGKQVKPSRLRRIFD